ncbi:MAG: hypothetical protein QOG62_19 [Thermoleophilaceae bacterium]|nr:hypothetical protein [Thermoleophilaceae bacterium]
MATELTRGPWSPVHQHAGPPAALIGRQIERTVGAGWHIGRVTLEILRAVPMGLVSVDAEVVRPGRTVQLVEATLDDETGPVILARAWAIKQVPVEFLEPRPGVDITPEPPETGELKPFFPTGSDVGYHTATEVRFLEGAFREPGPARAWISAKAELVAGEGYTPLTRVLLAADTGNGVSSPLDYRRYVFINTDLTVTLRRPLEGDAVLLDSVTYPDASGAGLTDTALFDRRGRIGRAVQTLVITAR